MSSDSTRLPALGAETGFGAKELVAQWSSVFVVYGEQMTSVDDKGHFLFPGRIFQDVAALWSESQGAGAGAGAGRGLMITSGHGSYQFLSSLQCIMLFNSIFFFFFFLMSLKAEFLNLSTIDILGQRVFGRGGLSWALQNVSLHLWPLSIPQLWQPKKKNVCGYCQRNPGCIQVGNHRWRVTLHESIQYHSARILPGVFFKLWFYLPPPKPIIFMSYCF